MVWNDILLGQHCLLTVPYHHSKFQKVLRVNSRKNAWEALGKVWVLCELLQNIVYCHFFYLFWPNIKQKFRKILSRFRKQNKQAFLNNALHHFGILGSFNWKWVPLLFFKYNELTVCKNSNGSWNGEETVSS